MVTVALATSSVTCMSPQTTEEKVREYFSDIPIMAEIARCESGFRHYLADGTVLRGRINPKDVGVMQINTYYHGETADELGLNLLNFDQNMVYARHLYENQGTQPWFWSEKCWG